MKLLCKMGNNKGPTKDRTLVVTALLASARKLCIIFIAVAAVIKACLTSEPNPMENDVNKRRRLVDILKVTDSTENGFKVIYATEESVSEARLKEIQSRPNLRFSLNRLRRDAPFFFGNLLNTDIYDFADFALQYDVEDIFMDKIFIYGKEKSELYLGPNPTLEDPAKWINHETLQGIQYINKNDIYNRRRDSNLIYRYWRCSGINATSSVDEHFSHFSEKDRIW